MPVACGSCEPLLPGRNTSCCRLSAAEAQPCILGCCVPCRTSAMSS